MRVVWFAVLGLAAAMAALLAYTEVVGEAPAPAPAPPARAVARPRDLPALGARRAENEPANALRSRVSAVPAFARLPRSDQAWVLAQADARVNDPNAPELVPLVEQLAEVRLFAVSEREEPLPAPDHDAEVR